MADMSPEEAEAYADLFCINAEVSAILERYREPRDVTAGSWPDVRRQALEDWRAGRVPIWRREPDGTQIYFGLENDLEACRGRDEYDETARERGA